MAQLSRRGGCSANVVHPYRSDDATIQCDRTYLEWIGRPVDTASYLRRLERPSTLVEGRQTSWSR